MMTTSRLLALPLLLCAPLLATAAPAAGLTPEQTFDLYARVLLEDDAGAARTLNDALRPAFDGKDAVTPAHGELAGAMAAPLQSLLAKQAGGARDSAAVPALMAANLRQTRCRATHAKVRDNTYVDDAKIASVSFTCQVTVLDALRPLFSAGLRDDSAENLKRFTDAYLLALRDAPRRELSGRLDLHPAKDNGYWYSGNLDALVSPVVDAVLPFNAWRQDALADAAPKVTGVPACDLLLLQHRQCIANTAPDQLPGVEAMADELKAKAATSTPAAMTQECKALRSMAEAMWDDDCR